MTTLLAIRNWNETFVWGDGRLSLGDQILSERGKKIHRIGNMLVGYAGRIDIGDRIVRLLKKKKIHRSIDRMDMYDIADSIRKYLQDEGIELWDDQVWDSWISLIIATSHKAFYVSNSFSVVEIEDGFPFGLGSGGTWAEGAYVALSNRSWNDIASNVLSSIGIACQFDSGSGGEIQVERIS